MKFKGQVKINSITGQENMNKFTVIIVKTLHKQDFIRNVVIKSESMFK